jgi:hypothetical protein
MRSSCAGVAEQGPVLRFVRKAHLANRIGGLVGQMAQLHANLFLQSPYEASMIEAERSGEARRNRAHPG